MIHSLNKSTTITADIFGSRLTLTFSNGECLEVDTQALSDEMKQAAMLHGLKQKLVDAGAIARNTETGQSATVEDKFAAVRAVHARITSATPSWNAVKGEASSSSSNLFLRALMQMTQKNRAAIEEFLEGKSKEEKAALRKNPRVAGIMAELSAASGTGGIDTNAMLEELIPAPLDATNVQPMKSKARAPKASA